MTDLEFETFMSRLDHTIDRDLKLLEKAKRPQSDSQRDLSAARLADELYGDNDAGR
jgi:hypothetical protein